MGDYNPLLSPFCWWNFSSFGAVPVSFITCPHPFSFVFSTYLLSDIARRSRFILRISCSNLRISHFSKKHGFFYCRMAFKNQDLGFLSLREHHYFWEHCSNNLCRQDAWTNVKMRSKLNRFLHTPKIFIIVIILTCPQIFNTSHLKRWNLTTTILSRVGWTYLPFSN